MPYPGKGKVEMYMVNSRRVLRFGKVAIFAHWANAISFFLLAFTGLMIYVDVFDFLLPVFGGIQGARIIHRAAAVAFIVIPILGVLANPEGFRDWMKNVLTWNQNDRAFLAGFPKKFFGGHPEIPPQGRFNAGEKVNSLLQLGGCTLLAITGIVMWNPDFFPKALVLVGYPLHDLAFVLTGTATLGHAYLALVHPDTKAALSGMINGYIDVEYAKSHYPLWYKEIEKGGGVEKA